MATLVISSSVDVHQYMLKYILMKEICHTRHLWRFEGEIDDKLRILKAYLLVTKSNRWKVVKKARNLHRHSFI